MKHVWVLTLLTLSLPAVAYQAVTTSRANFGGQDPTQEQSAQNTAATRTFSTYQSRQQNWSKETQKPQPTAQTNPNPSIPSDGEMQHAVSAALNLPSSGGASAAQPTATAQGGKKASNAPAKGTPAPVQETAKPKSSFAYKGSNSAGSKPESVASPDTAATGQQPSMESIQKMMGSNTDMMKAFSGSGASNGAMPDISKLLGGNQPKK